MVSNYLFVYGTLLQSVNNSMSKFLIANSTNLGPAYCFGKLYKITWFPGAVLSENESEKIYGTLVKLHDNNNVLSHLDDYEGYNSNNASSSLFIRQKNRIYTEKGIDYMAWMYIYNQKTDEATRILSGDFLNHGAF
ncbi:gamma-glutamylcyclotransferase [Tamlana sp. 62-3]|uniref:Gamma-glutamylcyclotransferase n=1 Tax=Neotamlana sargassicola TaxID=2883125 RepID=A0A9X1I6P2_9FLAO|nr:gamma-glutamylcyclotransferase family protein [Tamlana sargassicola]MCB4808272.1 gamma-glutamylcyclotransferase [Tamlana sargassicola]